MGLHSDASQVKGKDNLSREEYEEGVEQRLCRTTIVTLMMVV